MSWQTAARMPLTLLAAIDAPTPVPQTMMPRSASPDLTFWVSARAMSRKVDRLVIERSDVDDLMSERADMFDHRILERPSGVIRPDYDAH